VGAQAADGMRLDRSYATLGTALKDLDSPEVFAQHVAGLIASLTDLRKAPLVGEEYHGPVLLSSDAGADTLTALLSTEWRRRGPSWAPRRAPTDRLPPATMRACCRSFWT
jgi:hypothetical protein